MEDIKKEKLERSKKRLAKIIYENRDKILEQNARFEAYKPVPVMIQEDDDKKNSNIIFDALDNPVTRFIAKKDPTLMLNIINNRSLDFELKKNFWNSRVKLKIPKNANKLSPKVLRRIYDEQYINNFINKDIVNKINRAKPSNTDASKLKQIYKAQAKELYHGKMSAKQLKKYEGLKPFYKNYFKKNPKMKKVVEPNIFKRTIYNFEHSLKNNPITKKIVGTNMFKKGISYTDDLLKKSIITKPLNLAKKIFKSPITKQIGKNASKAFSLFGDTMNVYTLTKENESGFKKILAGLDLAGGAIARGITAASGGTLAPVGGLISGITSGINFAGTTIYDFVLPKKAQEVLDEASKKYVINPVKKKIEAFKKNPIKEAVKTSMFMANPLGYGAFKLAKKVSKPFIPKITSTLKTAKNTVSNSIKAKVEAFKKNPIKEAVKTFNPLGYGAFKLAKKVSKPFIPKITSTLKTAKNTVSNSIKAKVEAFKKNPVKEAVKTFNPVGYKAFELGKKSAELLKVKAAPLISKATKQIEKAKTKSLNFIKSIKDKLFKEKTNNSFNLENRLNQTIKGRTRGIGITNNRKPSEKLIRGVKFRQTKPSSRLIDLYRNESRSIKNNNTRTNHNRRILEAKLQGNKKYNSNKNNFTININGSGLSVDDMANELASKIQTTMANMYA